MRFGSSALVTNGSMSGNVISWGIDLQQDWICSVQANWSGPSVGTIKLQGSNDNVVVGFSGENPATNVINWADISGTLNSVSAVAGSSSFIWNINYPGFRWIRGVYVQSSGSGEISMNFFGKGV